MAPFGILGLETEFALFLTILVHQKKTIDLKRLITLYTANPAALVRLPKGTLRPGADADITLIDPELVLASSSALLGVDLSDIESAETAAITAGNQGVQGSLDRMRQVAKAQGISFAQAVRKPRGLCKADARRQKEYGGHSRNCEDRA